jgi:hypothetical protein
MLTVANLIPQQPNWLRTLILLYLPLVLKNKQILYGLVWHSPSQYSSL